MKWTAADAARLYRVDEWGQGYFAVDANGRIVVCPDGPDGPRVALHDIVAGLDERGFAPPVLLRFPDVLRSRLREIRDAFDRAIDENGYTGDYHCVYPIKVNQQRHVCEEVRDIGATLRFGLEAGSKPELLAVLALTVEHPTMPIVCNGFKDEGFIETVVLATKLGRTIIPVVEKFSELEAIVRQARIHEVTPQIGIRIKPASQGAGRWQLSSGSKSKFGLFINELLDAVDYLREHEMLHALRMLHCHIGSQVTDIRRMKTAISELAHVYAELVRLGAPMGMIDVGGGLGIDYDGSRSTNDSSMNYSLEEYAADVVYRIANVCDDAAIPHPAIFSESGRAMVSYSSVLVFDILGASRYEADIDLGEIRAKVDAEGDDVPQPVYDLLATYTEFDDTALAVAYHDAIQARDESLSLFTLGYMSLPWRAVTEGLFWAIGRRIVDRAANETGPLPEGVAELPEFLSDTYFCNFSIFQSIPDSWAIDQVFPICPIHRLDEEPTRRAVLADITCDSDGRIDRFVDATGDKRTLELHELRPGEPYRLGAFLLGAYQEILGDLHNLLGDTHVVHVGIDPSGEWSIDEIIEGDTVREVLGYVQFESGEMRKAMRRNVEAALKEQRLTVSEGKSLLRFYEDGLAGYTYLD